MGKYDHQPQAYRPSVYALRVEVGMPVGVYFFRLGVNALGAVYGNYLVEVLDVVVGFVIEISAMPR